MVTCGSTHRACTWDVTVNAALPQWNDAGCFMDRGTTPYDILLSNIGYTFSVKNNTSAALDIRCRVQYKCLQGPGCPTLWIDMQGTEHVFSTVAAGATVTYAATTAQAIKFDIDGSTIGTHVPIAAAKAYWTNGVNLRLIMYYKPAGSGTYTEHAIHWPAEEPTPQYSVRGVISEIQQSASSWNSGPFPNQPTQTILNLVLKNIGNLAGTTTQGLKYRVAHCDTANCATYTSLLQAEADSIAVDGSTPAMPCIVDLSPYTPGSHQFGVRTWTNYRTEPTNWQLVIGDEPPAFDIDAGAVIGGVAVAGIFGGLLYCILKR